MNILMPQLGETVAEGKVTKSFKSAGDAVQPGDNLFEIETDKVSMEVPGDRSRRAERIRVQEGETAPVGAIVGVIGGAAGAGQVQRRQLAQRASAPERACRFRDPARCSSRIAAGKHRRRASADQARPLLRSAHARAQFRPAHGSPAASP